MLKWLFWTLLASNIVLFAFQRLYLDTPPAGKREPERLAQQYNKERIRLLPPFSIAPPQSSPLPRPSPATSAETVQTVPPPAKPASPPKEEVPPPAEKAPPPAEKAAPSPAKRDSPGTACVEIGHFPREEAARFEKALSAKGVKTGISRQKSQTGSQYMVFIPASAASDAKMVDLFKKGVQHYRVKDGSPQQGALSLGVFGTREAAQRYSARLAKKGVKGTQIVPRGNIVERTLYRVDRLTPVQKKEVESLSSRFPRQTLRRCSRTKASSARAS
ncbi:MAG: hypothetical protein LBK01_05660 [Burkholderiaceae bacterium]|jgi:hypothetical protein|nr:hypothetical protein [Burkholderiaceae bacterium]